MSLRRVTASAAAATIVLLLLAAGVAAQTLAPPKLNAEQRMRAQALSKLVDEVAWDQHSAPADVVLSWQGGFFGADKGLVYIPYTLGIDGKFNAGPVAMYVRVLAKDAFAPSFDPSKTTTMKSWLGMMSMVVDMKDLRSGSVDGTGLIAEDVQFFEVPKDGRLVHGMWLPPGEYNVFVAMQEKAGKGLPKTVVLKQPLVVPDLSSHLALSSLVIADRVEPAVPTSKQRNQLDDPYAIGGNRITPSLSTRLQKDREMTVVFCVYNATLGADGKPDLQADYTFYANNAGIEHPFSKSAPQLFNSQTLPANFNSAIHQIMGGESVPLSSFPDGDYLLEVKMTDEVANTATVGSTTFSVFSR